MDFHKQREHALELLAQAGIDSSSYAPPMMLLLWRCGVKIKPPHFMGFGANALLSGAWFGVCWGVVMWMMLWYSQGVDVRLALAGAGIAGLCFGLFMASYYARQREKHGLPSWESLR
jgi:small-conductance mechanosensitive channel